MTATTSRARLFGLSLCLACAQGVEGGRSRDRPIDDGGVGGPDSEAQCPEDPPKVGEACPPRSQQVDRCEYAVGECRVPSGVVYTEFIAYCCVRDLWDTCGGRSACDGFDGGLEPDATRPPDARAPDAGAPDLPAREAPAEPAPPDAAPDQSTVDSGNEDDTAAARDAPEDATPEQG